MANSENKEPSVTIQVILWWLANLVFGLIPLLACLVINLFDINDKTNVRTLDDIKHTLGEGILIFLFLAIIGSIGYDIYSSRRHFNPIFVSVYKWLAVGTAVATSFYYVVFVVTNDENAHFGHKLILTIVLGITALVFCTIGKISLILKEK